MANKRLILVLLAIGGFFWAVAFTFLLPGEGSSPPKLFIAYPPPNHQTTSDRIFLIGTAAPPGNVLVNQKPIKRSAFGHFAPSFPLQLGENSFQIQYQNQLLSLVVKRLPATPLPPKELGFLEDSLYPSQSIVRQVGERICFRAIATPKSQVSVKFEGISLPLTESDRQLVLPENTAVLTGNNQPIASKIGRYTTCTTAQHPGTLSNIQYRLQRENTEIIRDSKGEITILAPEKLESIVVIADQAVARTGPSSEFSRLTPLPKGTTALVTGREGVWLRLEYGGWVDQKETQNIDRAIPPHSLLRSVSSRQQGEWTEILFPLEVPVPITIQQEQQKLTLTLHHVTAQTDTTFLIANPLIDRMDGYQRTPDRMEFSFQFHTKQQWGYTTRYEGTTLVLALRHPPHRGTKPLEGTLILLDPGHGSTNDLGSRGPTGYPEKDVTLHIAKLLGKLLQQQGAKIIFTRQGDEDIYPIARAQQIERTKPTLALSIHYNALPDHGDAINTKGISTFWYHPQSHDLAKFLHDYLTNKLNRSSYGVFWNNLALTRPTVAPTVLLELGFMIHPEEFAWITDRAAQNKLVQALSTGISLWLDRRENLDMQKTK